MKVLGASSDIVTPREERFPSKYSNFWHLKVTKIFKYPDSVQINNLKFGAFDWTDLTKVTWK
jgi:hypothetical protein